MSWRPGPGLLVTAAFLGPGTLATATLAGAQAGYALLWVLPLAVGLAYVLQEAAARLQLTTGRPLAQLIRSSLGSSPGPGWWLAAIAVGAVVLGAAAFQAGNLAGAVLGLEGLAGGPRAAWIIAVADVAFLLLWFGAYRLVATVLAGLVALMAGAFLLQLALVGVDLSQLAGGLVPSNTDLRLALALVGTTVVPYNLFLHGSAIQASHPDHDSSHITGMRYDLAASLVVGGLVTAAVLLSAAATLQGQDVTSAAEMAATLGPALGPLAQGALSIGLLAAGLSSAITAPLAAAWAVDQLRDRRSDRPARAVSIPVLAVGTLVALLPGEPVPLILAAQVANGFLLPLLAGILLLLACRPGTRLGGWTWTGLALATLITLALAVRLIV